MRIPRTITVWVDTREKQPLLFPPRILIHRPESAWGNKDPQVVKILPKKHKLDCGDYAVKGFESVVLVERKGSIGELMGNTSKTSSRRFLSQINRLADACDNPYLYLECLPSSTWQKIGGKDFRKGGHMDPMRALDLLFDILAERRIHLIWGGRNSTRIGTRRKLGELMLRLMLKTIAKA